MEKDFRYFLDISFRIHNKETDCLDLVICRIVGMIESDYKKNNGYIVADKVEINRSESSQCVFCFKDMLDVNYVYCD